MKKSKRYFKGLKALPLDAMTYCLAFTMFVVCISCSQSLLEDVSENAGCDVDFPAWEASPFILPYKVGTIHGVLQGTCGTVSHFKDGNRFAYDFEMQIGTPIIAVQKGLVTSVRDSFPNFNGKGNGENHVFIAHEDGTKSIYGHLSPNSVSVEEGQIVEQGDEIALSGASALNEENLPHIHFNVAKGANSIPITFKNTAPNPYGPQRHTYYEALPF